MSAGLRKDRQTLRKRNASARKRTIMDNKQNNMGIAIGMIVCALVLLAFPKFTGMVNWASWIFYAVGLLILCIGILGACIEKFK